MIAAFLPIPAEASAQAGDPKIELTADGIVAVFNDPKSAREECWAKVGGAAPSKRFRLKKLERCLDEFSEQLKDKTEKGDAIYSRPGDVTTVQLGDSTMTYTILWAIGSQGVLKNDDLSLLKKSGSKLVLVVAGEDKKVSLIRPITGKLQDYTVDEDGILATSDDPATRSDECWTSDAKELGKYRPKRLGCVDLSRIAGLGPPQDVSYDTSGPSMTVKLDREPNPREVYWALGNDGPIPGSVLKSLDPSKLHDEYLLVVQGHGQEPKVKAVHAKQPVPPPSQPAPPPSQPAPDPWSTTKCKQNVELPKGPEPAWVCIDLVGGFRTFHAPPANLLEPKQSLIVVVRHTAGEKVTLELSGDRRIPPPMLSLEPTELKNLAALTQDQAYPRAIVQFSPRRPGVLDLKIKSELKGRDPAEYKVELEVDQRYWGAARFGLGTLFDLADNFHGYDVKTFAGSQTAQIRDAHIPVQFELVTGFALYPESLWDNGRSYADKGFSRKNIHVSPFLGFGLVGQDAKGIAALTSVHMGVELEFARDFSVALTAVWKRTRVLSAGYAPGSPVAANASEDEFSSTKFVPGFGVVLNATPSFLQFATGDADKEAK
ncbi:hypothetical protein BE08_41135 [Sorangium cellulosum]|uniref:Uncharacterized protein n=1 Tax=Sorangium cellulosum TaxID=56 RepID=A0A150PQY3_SORCE|nr:hypothetical protein BE08_41135 [Sorangium cellulosum]